LPDTKYTGTVFGFFDEGALETGLRVKDIDDTTILDAVSLGKEDKTYTQYLYANGYNNVCYLNANSDFDSKNTAKELSSYIKDKGYDLILMGESVGPMDTGSVPYLMSNLLDCPIINNISEVTVQDNHLVLTRETSESIELYQIDSKSSVIAVISNAKHPYLRLASYVNKEKVKDISADQQKAADGKANVRFVLPENKMRSAKYIAKEELKKLLNEIGDMS